MATYTLISSVTVGSGGAANIEFTSIPATYTDLLVKFSARTTKTGQTYDETIISLNNSTANFSVTRIYGSGSVVGSAGGTTLVFIDVSNSATANTFSNNELYLPNYASSNYKSYSVDNVTENNATETYSELLAGLWSNTSAITSIKFTSYYAENYMQYTTAYLYGISNA